MKQPKKDIAYRMRSLKQQDLKEALQANLVVDIGEKQHCVYGTPYGDFMIGITAKTIRSDLDENGGMLFFHYVLDVNSSYIGDFEIAIEVKAANVVA